MDFTGTGRRLSEAGYTQAARDLGCEVAAIKALVEVEASGRGFDAENRPKALFEPHKFYRHLGPGSARDKAVLQKLAYPKWKPGNYPRGADGVYDQLRRACAINEDAALKATSWGLGQVLGEYFDDAGFASVQDFVRANLESEDRQLAIMCDLLQAWGYADELARLDWAGVARGWNGPRYRENAYDAKLARAYATAGGDHTSKALPFKAVKFGDDGDQVREVQQLLTRAGFAVKVDGDYGDETKRLVRLFQLDNGLAADGVVGPATMAKLKSAPEHKVPEQRTEATPAEVKQASTIAKNADTVKKSAGGAAGIIASLGVSEQLGILRQVGEYAQQASGTATQVQSAAATILPLVQQYWWLAATLALLIVAFYGHRIVEARIADFRSGKTR